MTPLGSVSPVSPARVIEGVRVRTTDRLAVAPHSGFWGSAPKHTRATRGGFDWNALTKTRPATRASSQRNPLQRKTARATASPSRRQVRSDERTRGPTGMETPKRDRPEAGRPGQRECDQRALQGTQTSREAPDQYPGRDETWHLVPVHRVSEVGPVVTLRVALVVLARVPIDSAWPGGRGRLTPKRRQIGRGDLTAGRGAWVMRPANDARECAKDAWKPARSQYGPAEARENDHARPGQRARASGQIRSATIAGRPARIANL
jgi:hypothetical protein